MTFTYPKVRFQCTKCGICCGDTKEKTRHILLLESEVKQIAKKISRQPQDFSTEVQDKKPYLYEMRKADGKCIFLNGENCSIYHLRPLICRFYPFELKFDEVKNQYIFECTPECPSVNSGKLMDEGDFRRLFRLANNRLSN